MIFWMASLTWAFFDWPFGLHKSRELASYQAVLHPVVAAHREVGMSVPFAPVVFLQTVSSVAAAVVEQLEPEVGLQQSRMGTQSPPLVRALS